VLTKSPTLLSIVARVITITDGLGFGSVKAQNDFYIAKNKRGLSFSNAHSMICFAIPWIYHLM
jgi:hypothetical protein